MIKVIRRFWCLQSDCEVSSSLCAENEICVPNYKDNTAECKCRYASGDTGKPCGEYHV